MKNIFKVLTYLVFLNFIVFTLPTSVIAVGTSPSLGTAASYSILAGTSVTNTGPTSINGNVGISPGAGGNPNYTGFGTVTLGGVINDANSAALIAMGDKDIAFASLGSQACDTTYAGTKELAGLVLVPGVYCANSFHLTNGTLTLNGDASGVWVFKSASDLILTGTTSNVVLTGGGLPCNVWWRVVSTGTVGPGGAFLGNILASTSITLGTSGTLNGRALAGTGNVTMDTNIISGPTCSVPPTAATSNVVQTVANTAQPPIRICPTLSPAIIAPEIIEARRVSGTSVYVNWGPYSGTDQFNVRYGPTDGNWLYNTDVRGFSTTIDSLPANTTMWFQAAARNECLLGTYGKAKQVDGSSNGGPRLPKSGNNPTNSNVLLLVIAGLASSISGLIIVGINKLPSK